ncbi:DEAD/DEAH box helicase [Halobacillus sp. A5]|uniref:DEAD/DEAH box helicase n=1 Tax=Halobacillus sp. A5 TaxID=2880263 RepID=UPI0020A63303|nr:helicase-related protein [Halobacillus sp. A5]MCP3028096.1 DEAD/DEAH box helicase family protein [Halobacillus sp. A5]
MLHLFNVKSPHSHPQLSPIPSNSPYKQLSGRLLTRNEIPLDENELQQLIQHEYVYKLPSITSNRCGRCGADESHLFGHFPHCVCGCSCCYCRNCVMMGRVTECESLYIFSSCTAFKKHEAPCNWEGNLTIGQQNAAERIISSIKRKEELLVWAVCGAGKTEMLFPGITYALRQGLRICIATPRTDVVRELLPRLQSAFADVDIQGLYGDSEEKLGSAQLLIATTHQLYRYTHAFDVVIIDEIDAFPFHNDKSLKWAASRAAKKASAQIYLTATPRKEEKKRIRKKQLSAVFIPSRFHGHPLPVPKLKLTPTLRSRLSKGALPSSILSHISNQRKGKRQLLLFASTIQSAENIASLLSLHYSVKSVHAEDPERADKINSFRNLEIDILVTTTILERGVTFPSVDVFVIDAGHQVFDEAALVQISGRAGRSPDDPDGRVIFFHIGKTEAMLEAQAAIEKMNLKAKKQ